MPIPGAKILEQKELIEDVIKVAVNKYGDKAGPALREVLSTDACEVAKDAINGKLALNVPGVNLKKLDIKEHMSKMEVIKHFFGWNSNWKISRCLLGGFMIHSPEYPTYFMPAFTQAKATGDATELKKGEGPRGIFTGALEGIAVGALVSGEKLKGKEMIPFIFLGAGLQLFSSIVFPYLGEKCGQYIYKKNLAKTGGDASTKLDVVSKADAEISAKTDLNPHQVQQKTNPVQFKGQFQYLNSGSLKI